MSDHVLWIPFGLLVILLFSVDLFLLGREGKHDVSMKEAGIWVIAWICLAMIFNGVLWWMFSTTHGAVFANAKALEFLTGYLVEWSLSIDNVFVFFLIFSYFSIPSEYQRKVLIYGVVVAIILRVLVILFGSWLVAESEWVLFLFGVILLVAGIQLLLAKDEKTSLANNKLLHWLHGYLRVTDKVEGDHFFVREQGLLFATPLFFVLLCLAVCDVIFAFDSVPAIFAITLDPLIIITSNIFAMMGLRSLYFLFAKMADSFHLLKYGLAVILLFVAAKIMLRQWVEIPTLLTLAVIILSLLIAIILSVYSKTKS